MPGEAVMLKQVEIIANVKSLSTSDNLLESYKFGQMEVKLAVATFMEEEPRFLDEEEQKKVLCLRFFNLEQNMTLRYLAFGGRDDDGTEGETGTTGIQITHFL